MKTRIFLILGASLVLAACATAPKPLQGQFSSVSPRDSVAQQQTGTPVRWGGRIIETLPGQGETCFQMLARPLTGSGRPSSTASDASDGRFLACRAGFYDPAVFEVNREVTFTGRLEGYENRRIGEYDYRFPRVAADVVYLWPQRERVDVVVRPTPAWGWGWW